MISMLVYLVLLIIYFGVLLRTRPREPEEGDRKVEGEEVFIKLALILNLVWMFSMTLPFYTSPVKILDPTVSAIIGCVLFASGLAIRTIAIRTLGRLFTFKLTIRPEHQLIKEGLYKFVRHPSYTGTLLQLLGMMVAARSWIGLLGLCCSAGVIIVLRIVREEKMLVQTFGQEYIHYMKETKRLIPWIF